MKSNLLKPGFLALTITQFFGAANDNVLKGVLIFMVVDGAWSSKLGIGGAGFVSICFTVPFILLSGYAGQFADRFSKSRVSMVIKWAELPIALTAMYGFWNDNLWVTLLALIALSCQSAFFGPAKYGMIPELVDRGDLSRANGTINMMTNIAVILGTVLAGKVSDYYYPQVEDGLAGTIEIPWLPGAVLCGFAILGIIAVRFLGRLPVAGDPNEPFDWNPFSTYISSIRAMAKTRLLTVMLAWGYFYMLAGIALLVIPQYVEILNVNRTEASYLMALLGVAIGLGCVLAGLISGHHIELRLVPVGAFLLALFFFLLGIQPTRVAPLEGSVLLTKEALFILGAGISAGFYIVPLQSLLQGLSPDDERGSFLGTANAVSFTFMTLSSPLYMLSARAFQDHKQRIFLVCAALLLVGAGVFLTRLRGSGVFRRRTFDTVDTMETP